jgi:acyl-CoA synthetase (AMP-forming)/AMP-acid ligase II
VAEAVSFGVKDEKYGEEVHAAVVLKTPGGASEVRYNLYLLSW